MLHTITSNDPAHARRAAQHVLGIIRLGWATSPSDLDGWARLAYYWGADVPERPGLVWREAFRAAILSERETAA